MSFRPFLQLKLQIIFSEVFFILCFITNLALTTGYPNTKSADNEISAPGSDTLFRE